MKRFVCGLVLLVGLCGCDTDRERAQRLETENWYLRTQMAELQAMVNCRDHQIRVYYAQLQQQPAFAQVEIERRDQQIREYWAQIQQLRAYLGPEKLELKARDECLSARTAELESSRARATQLESRLNLHESVARLIGPAAGIALLSIITAAFLAFAAGRRWEARGNRPPDDVLVHRTARPRRFGPSACGR